MKNKINLQDKLAKLYELRYNLNNTDNMFTYVMFAHKEIHKGGSFKWIKCRI